MLNVGYFIRALTAELTSASSLRCAHVIITDCITYTLLFYFVQLFPKIRH